MKKFSELFKPKAKKREAKEAVTATVSPNFTTLEIMTSAIYEFAAETAEKAENRFNLTPIEADLVYETTITALTYLINKDNATVAE